METFRKIAQNVQNDYLEMFQKLAFVKLVNGES